MEGDASKMFLALEDRTATQRKLSHIASSHESTRAKSSSEIMRASQL